MLKLLKIIVASVVLLPSLVFAQYTMVVPQAPGGGTSVWASIVAKELEKKLGEKIHLQHIQGANDVPGATKFHNELRYNDKTIMVAHGGNAESYLLQDVEYDYREWEPIGLMNLTIVVGHRSDFDPYTQRINFAKNSGSLPDALAITLMVCGPQADFDTYLDCFREKVNVVNGMSGNERRLSYMRGELNTSRETTAAYYKHLQGRDFNQLWFSHGVMDLETGEIKNDPNFPNAGSFDSVYEKKWGERPSGPLYDAYVLVKNYRDALQKSLWVNKGNPNGEKLQRALMDMVNDPISMNAIEEQAGKYEWVIGSDANSVVDILYSQTLEQPLSTLVRWYREAFQQSVVFNDSLLK